MATETKNPIGYETNAIEFGEMVKNLFGQLMKAIAWSGAKKEGRETVTPQDIAKAADIATKVFHEFLDSHQTISRDEILEGLRTLAKRYEPSDK